MQTIGILGTGDMGSAVARVLRGKGARVVTALSGRTQASRALAAAAGMEDLGSLEQMIGEADLVLSILPPAQAHGFACDVAAIIKRTGRPLTFADCNAIAPATVEKIAGLFAETSAGFFDVGIVGPPPRSDRPAATRFYVAGADRTQMLNWNFSEIEIIDMGADIGRASAIKMCYAALNKGVDALYANILLAARRLGVESELRQELQVSQPEAYARIVRRIPFLAATAARYTGEMREIAASFETAGVSGDFHRGAAWLYALLAQSSLATETRASLPAQRSLGDALDAFAAVLDPER